MCAIKKPIKKALKKPEINKIHQQKSLKSEEEKDQIVVAQTEQEAASIEEATHLEQDTLLQEQPKSPLDSTESEQQADLTEQQPENSEAKCESPPPEVSEEVVFSEYSITKESETTEADEMKASMKKIKAFMEWKKTLKPITPQPQSCFVAKDGAVTVVNDRNSKRVKLKQPVMEGLGYPNFVKFYVTDEEFVVQASPADAENVYELRLEGKRKCLIYNTELIKLLTEMFELDFTNGTSQTFGEVKFECIDDVKYAIITNV